jgi:RNA polymerase sigma factor (TIGR02999 family)
MTTPFGSRLSEASPPDVTQLLHDWSHGDRSAGEGLMAAVYAELHQQAARAMGRETPAHTLQATALVSEAYLRLIDQSRVQWRNRAHFFGVAAQLMRRILVDHARGRLAAKRGGGVRQITLGEADPAVPRLTMTASMCSRSTRRSSTSPRSIPVRRALSSSATSVG